MDILYIGEEILGIYLHRMNISSRLVQLLAVDTFDASV